MPKNQRVLAITCILAAGCGWGQADPAVLDELAEVRAELARVRAELVELRADSDLQAEAITVALPESSVAVASRRRSTALANDVDADLGDLQGQLDDHSEQLEQLHLEFQAISDVVNAHAIQLHEQSVALSDLDAQTTGLRTLEGVLSFEGGRVVVDGADVLLRAGQDPDGSPRPAGQILNRVP